VSVRQLASTFVALALAITAQAAGPGSIEPKDLNERIAWADGSLVVLDVRAPADYAQGHIPGAINIPQEELAARVAELEGARERDIVVYCGTGKRTAQALQVLEKSGFRRIFHLKGDFTRWSEEKRPVVGKQ
jgi:phage shock protein E